MGTPLLPFLLQASRNALVAVCAGSLFAFVLTLPFVDYGQWRQVETATVAVHISAGLAAVIMTILAICGDRAVRRAVFSAPALLLIAIGLLSFALSPFHDDPVRTLFGLLKHGVGALWWISVGILTAAFAVAGRGRARTVLAGAAAVSTVCVFLLYAFGWSAPEPRWIPYDFKEWVAILGLLAAVPLLAIRTRASVLVAAVIVVVALAFFGNRSIMLTVGLSAAGYGLWLPLRSRVRTRSRTVLAAALAAAAVGGTVLVAALPPLLERHAVAGVSADARDPIPSKDPRDHVSIEGKAYGTIWSRGVVLDLVARNMAHHPLALLTGRGWGSLQEVVAEDGRSVPGRRFRFGPETASLTFLDFNANADFHSHNLLAEAGLSLGLPGVVLTLLAFLAPVACARRRSLAAAGVLSATLLVAGSLWFLLGIMGPFLALAIASVGLGREPSPARRLPVPALAPALGVSSLGLLFCSMLLFGFGKAQQEERWFFPLSFFSAPPCATVTGPLLPAREINTGLYRRFVEQAERAGSPAGGKAYAADHRGNAINFACVMRRLADEKPSATVLAASLELRQRIFSVAGNDPLFVASLKPDVVYWEADLAKLWSVAPGRTELAVPYVSWLISVHDPKMPQIAGRLASSMRDGDPVKAWILARKAEAEGDRAAQGRHIRDALDQGIANLVPIPSASVERAMQAASR